MVCLRKYLLLLPFLMVFGTSCDQRMISHIRPKTHVLEALEARVCPIEIQNVKTELFSMDGVWPVYVSENEKYFVTAEPCMVNYRDPNGELQVVSEGYYDITVYSHPANYDIEIVDDSLVLQFQLLDFDELDIEVDELAFVFGEEEFDFQKPNIYRVSLTLGEGARSNEAVNILEAFEAEWDQENLTYTFNTDHDSEWFLTQLQDGNIELSMEYIIDDRTFNLNEAFQPNL